MPLSTLEIEYVPPDHGRSASGHSSVEGRSFGETRASTLALDQIESFRVKGYNESRILHNLLFLQRGL